MTKHLTEKKTKGAPWIEVRSSALHGNGVFAIKNIPQGTKIIEYTGKRITQKKADKLWPVNPNDPFHTFFFSLSNGKIIDGGDKGNESRWINHSCEPNCETQEGKAGNRVYIYAVRDIKKGEELFYDYSLTLDEPLSKKVRNHYRCLCQSKKCRGTMLALPDELDTKS